MGWWQQHYGLPDSICDSRRQGAMRNNKEHCMNWLDRLVVELAAMCRESLGDRQRTIHLCLLVLAIAGGLALILWAARG